MHMSEGATIKAKFKLIELATGGRDYLEGRVLDPAKNEEYGFSFLSLS